LCILMILVSDNVCEENSSGLIKPLDMYREKHNLNYSGSLSRYRVPVTQNSPVLTISSVIIAVAASCHGGDVIPFQYLP